MAYGFNEDKTKASIEDIAAASMADKVDKVAGKGLTDNNYTDADKAIVDGFTANLGNKVDKVSGKGLSTNDFTTALKTKVDERSYNTFGSGVVLARNGSSDYSTYTCPHDGYLYFVANSGGYSPSCEISGSSGETVYISYKGTSFFPNNIVYVKKGTIVKNPTSWESGSSLTYYPFVSYS